MVCSSSLKTLVMEHLSRLFKKVLLHFVMNGITSVILEILESEIENRRQKCIQFGTVLTQYYAFKILKLIDHLSSIPSPRKS